MGEIQQQTNLVGLMSHGDRICECLLSGMKDGDRGTGQKYVMRRTRDRVRTTVHSLQSSLPNQPV